MKFNRTSAKLKDLSARFRTHKSFVKTAKAVKGRRDARKTICPKAERDGLKYHLDDCPALQNLNIVPQGSKND